MKKFLIASFLLIFNIASYAAPGWTGRVKICAVQSNAHMAYVQVCGAYQPKVCGKATFLRWELNTSNGPELYSTAMLALSLDKDVQLYAAAAADCADTYDYLGGIKLWK